MLSASGTYHYGHVVKIPVRVRVISVHRTEDDASCRCLPRRRVVQRDVSLRKGGGASNPSLPRSFRFVNPFPPALLRFEVHHPRLL